MFTQAVPNLIRVFEKVFVACTEEPECLQEASDILHLVVKNMQPFDPNMYK